MQIKLLKECARAIVCEHTALLTDVKDGAELSFLLPDDKQYVAIFFDEKGLRTQVEIQNGKASIPERLLRPQIVQLYVAKVEDAVCVKMYACEPLQIRAFDNMLKSRLEVTGAMSESDVRQRLVDLDQQFCTQVQKYNAAVERLDSSISRYNAAVERFNQAVETINAINERLTALEANYDPTIVK